jgi:opacity protein-like surface antigen
VFGVEADFESFRPKGSQNVTGTYGLLPLALPCSPASAGGGCQFGFSQSSDGKWLTTVRGKVGAVWGNWLFYGTMGVAWARMSFTSNFADVTAPSLTTLGVPGGIFNANLVNGFTVTQTKAGVVGGFGLSYMLNRNWIVSVEYLRTEIWGIGGDSLASTTLGNAPVVPTFPAGTFNALFHYDTTYIENVVRAKVDYKF